jgi:hypothetical protein
MEDIIPKKELPKVPNSFRSFEEYFEIWSELFVAEVKAKVASKVNQDKENIFSA